jgi:cytochrome P450
MNFPAGPKTPTWLQTMRLVRDPLKYMDELAQQYGDIFTLDFLLVPTVFVSNPTAIQQLFTQPKQMPASGDLNEFVAPLVGNQGLLLLDGPQHIQRRRLIMPAFHGDRIHTYGQRICQLTQDLMGRQSSGQAFSAIHMLDDLCLCAILEVVFGLKPGELYYESFRKVIPELLDHSLSTGMDFCFSIPALQRDWGKCSPWGKFLRLMGQLDQLIYAELDDRRRNPDPSRTDVLSELALAKDELGNSMPDQEIRDLVPSLIFAGQEASATAISWALYWVHHLPEVRKRVLTELDQLGSDPDPMAINGLPYLTAVCQEALRLYPTQTVTFPHRVETPVEIQGYTLPVGTIVRANIYLVHRREDLYANPTQFRPERFLDRQYTNYEFIPFGGGPRRCPGDVLALFEMKLVLATMLLNYELELVNPKPEYPRRRGVTFLPQSGLPLKITGIRSKQAKVAVPA